ncbi:Lipocalin-like domain-containing protein [Alternaria rosae]|uniref:Lipocalin-like domain-containing protein n=1 Tax=Alternaria rosae TaxID=1187941 RepID=UPI001E8D5B1D|nr:Lipocalin-like domain-containing protein [Alternaria rosae]KAH6878740.1 Lipocalin-like domain-containing protein [Alternaria rosae]
MRASVTPVILFASLASALPQWSDHYKPRANADTNPIFKALSGTYSLVNTSSSRNGEPIPDLPYGKAPVGLLIYTESGFMSATITATEPEFRPNLTFPYQPNDSDADWALVGKHSIGYAGPYSVNEELPATETEGQIFHGPLTVANVPTWEGQKGKRNYTIVEVEENGEEVKYLKIGSERGNGYRGILWWKKVV